MDRGPRTGVTGAVSASDLDLCEGVGPQGAGGGSWISDLGWWIDGGSGGEFYWSCSNITFLVRIASIWAMVIQQEM